MRATPRKSWLPWLAAATLLLSPLAWPQMPASGTASSARTLPSLGDGAEMTLGDERRLGDSIVRTLYRDPDYVDDPALMAYVDSIWQPLLASAKTRGDIPPEEAERYAWRLLLNRDKTVNAFSLPGGYLSLNLGLIGTVGDADELASVIAHELSHISQRHIARLLAQQGQTMPWMIGTMVLGVLAAAHAHNADVANAAIIGGQAAAIQGQLSFSRDMEREADRVGFGVMTEAGFDGLGFVTMFDKLQQSTRLNDNDAFPYLRNHPLTTERMADMRSRVPAQGTLAGHAHPTGIRPQPGLHAMMAARARVLADENVDRLRAIAMAGRNNVAPRRDPATLGMRYGAALAAAYLRDTATLQDNLGRLLAALPDDPAEVQAVRLLALEAMLMTQTTRLSGLNRDALRQEALASPTRPALILGARTALADRDSASLDEASQKLHTWVALHPADALAWSTASAVDQQLQQPVRAARDDAEARVAQLDLQGGLDRLRSAQSLARQTGMSDLAELSILDARTRELQAKIHEQFCDEHDKDITCQRQR